MESLPKDMLVEIFNHIDNQQQLIKLELVNNKFQSIIRTTKWIHIPFKIYYVQHLDFVIDNYNIGNYDFSNSLVDDSHVNKLTNCHTLNLSRCEYITEPG
jgi:hypothetical protein